MASSSSNDEPLIHQDIIDYYFRSDKETAEAISAEELAKLCTKFLNYCDMNFIRVVKSAKKYQKFNPGVILSQVLKNRSLYMAKISADLKWKLSFKDEDKSHYFTNKETLARDMNFLITMFLTHNNHMHKIINKASGSVKDILCMLKQKYVIKDSGTSLGCRGITLPRIAESFPGICVKLFHKEVVKEIVPYDTFPGCTKPETHAICCPMLQSVCPFTLKAVDGNNFHPVMIWVKIKMDDVIHRKNGKYTSIEDILGYYRVAFQSTAIPEKFRLKVFSYVGIIVQEENCSSQKWKLTDSAVQLARNCLSDLENMRNEDENHGLLMKLAKTGDF